MAGHDSRAIANIFIELAQKSGQRLTIMPLIKYVFFAHGWTLGITGKPLIRHEVQAWRYGPVVPEVYYAFRPKLIIKEEARNWLMMQYHTTLESVEEEIVGKVYERYSAMEPWDLSALTHEEGSPWDTSKKNKVLAIHDSVIREYYANKPNFQHKGETYAISI